MYKKLIGIVVFGLLIASAFQVTGIQINNEIENDSNIAFVNPNKLKDPLANWLEGSDQKQTEHDGYGFQVRTPFVHAQEFKPTKDKCTAVALEMFKYGSPPEGKQITVSIRDSLNGSDLTSKIRDADDITKGKWYLFDFEDIDVIPEETYYIVCSGAEGDDTNAFCWSFGSGNKYERGIAWASRDDGETWEDMENYGGWIEVDFCFITYFEKPNSRQVNRPFFNIFENYLNQFPILRQLLGFL